MAAQGRHDVQVCVIPAHEPEPRWRPRCRGSYPLSGKPQVAIVIRSAMTNRVKAAMTNVSADMLKHKRNKFVGGDRLRSHLAVHHKNFHARRMGITQGSRKFRVYLFVGAETVATLHLD